MWGSPGETLQYEMTRCIAKGFGACDARARWTIFALVPRLLLRAVKLVTVFAAIACTDGRSAGANDAQAPDTRARRSDSLVIFLAASLTRPMQPLLDSFVARTGAHIIRESGGSVEHARKLTELHRIPDLVVLADEEVFPRLLLPDHVEWYTSFARNRMVVAYTSRSRGAREITPRNWFAILAKPDVEVGRTDPDVAPAGYRTLLTLQLAERHYAEPGLATTLLATAPRRNMRSNAAELAALLQSGELDYIYEYESVARSNQFRFIRLPAEIDLGDPAFAAQYAQVSVRVRGKAPADSITVHGRPILYALSIPKRAAHAAIAERFAAFMLGPEGRRVLRAQSVDMLDAPLAAGTGIPSAIRAAAGF
jgi:molybdate/tungstate transport system substrate-binding protein